MLYFQVWPRYSGMVTEFVITLQFLAPHDLEEVKRCVVALKRIKTGGIGILEDAFRYNKETKTHYGFLGVYNYEEREREVRGFLRKIIQSFEVKADAYKISYMLFKLKPTKHFDEKPFFVDGKLVNNPPTWDDPSLRYFVNETVSALSPLTMFFSAALPYPESWIKDLWCFDDAIAFKARAEAARKPRQDTREKRDHTNYSGNEGTDNPFYEDLYARDFDPDDFARRVADFFRQQNERNQQEKRRREEEARRRAEYNANANKARGQWNYTQGNSPPREPKPPKRGRWDIPRTHEEAMVVLDITIADKVTVIKAYRALARQYHPDLPEGDAAIMQAINEAKRILSP